VLAVGFPLRSGAQAARGWLGLPFTVIAIIPIFFLHVARIAPPFRVFGYLNTEYL
jgi:hypothetical protein